MRRLAWILSAFAGAGLVAFVVARSRRSELIDLSTQARHVQTRHRPLATRFHARG